MSKLSQVVQHPKLKNDKLDGASSIFPEILHKNNENRQLKTNKVCLKMSDAYNIVLPNQQWLVDMQKKKKRVKRVITPESSSSSSLEDQNDY